MGIYIEKSSDPELYKDVYEEAQRLIRISDEIIVSVEKAEKTSTREKQSSKNETKIADLK
ncbi:hypothetical protein [Candidatus Nitrosacidococcus tergens]|uniref:Uncharacterized protein n=1 Tax=Candidatus Nitrosacidococcus tergens TaxID=553981 RepID=A0A7G1QA78_9GAMM|nr:hypothetical protein [Candidatus Nitrosacidococcus tergens]CAB1276174.1 conserved protein of unknown function [Candidatus Nitrosacidococcus tergens]